MHVQSNGKIRRSRAEWQTIFEQFSTSGLSMRAFCQREDLATGTFSKWMHRLDDRDEQPAAFVELSRRVAPSSSTLDAGEYELELPGGVRLRWKP